VRTARYRESARGACFFALARASGVG